MEKDSENSKNITNKVYIAYRACPKLSKNADGIFFQTKFEMFKVALKSFIKALEGIDYYIYFILDTCPDEYSEYIKSILSNMRFEIENMENAGNRKTFLRQIEVLSNQNYSDNIYFAEDDYIYSKHSLKKMVDIMDKNQVHFVSPYDHPDYYKNTTCSNAHRFIHNYKTRILYEDGMHFRMSSSTTMTFLTTAKILRKTSKAFRSYLKYHYSWWIFPNDYEIWLSLTHMKNFSTTFKDTVAMYLSLFLQFFKEKYVLLSPMPGLAYHMCRPCIERYGLEVVSSIIEENTILPIDLKTEKTDMA